METGLCQEIEDNEIKWKFQEILQLLRCFKEHILDFQQIANKMKGSGESNKRPKNFYTPQVCESAFKKILEMSKDKPYYVELFKTIPYSPEIHGFKLLEQYEEYNLKITEFVDKTLLNDKFKHLLVAMEKNELSPEMAEKIDKFCKAFPSLVQMAIGIEQYDKVLEKRSIFETLMPERDKIPNFQDLHITLTEKAEEYRVKKEAEANAAKASAAASAIASSKPGKSETPPQISTPNPRVAETKLPKSTPVSTAAGPSKRSRAPTPRPTSKSPIRDTPPAKKKRLPAMKIPAVEPAVEKPSTKNRRPSSAKKAASPHSKTPIPSDTCDGATQTYLSLIGKIDETNIPILIDKYKNADDEADQKGNKKTRTVMTQTGEIHFEFAVDMGTINWYDDGDVPNEVTVELVNACLRSNIDYETEKPMRVNMHLKEDTVTNPHIEELKKHPLYEIFLEIQKTDIEEYFYYPVKIELTEYPSWIKMPMDLLTIEDLMIQGKIKDIDDLEFYTNLMCTNAVVFGAIAVYAEDFAEKLADIFNEYRSKNRK